MKAPQFYITVVLSAICLILAVIAIQLGQSSMSLQTKLQQQQVEVNRGAQSNQLVKKLVNDMAQVSLKNERIKMVLARNGVTVNVASPTPSPAPTETTSSSK